MKLIRTLILAAAALVAATTGAFAQLNTTLLAQQLLGTDSAGLWVDGGRAYVARGAQGMSIIDVSNPAAPAIRGTFAPVGCHINDVQVVGNLAYMANYVPNNTGVPVVGVYIADVSDPNNPVEAGRIEWGMGGGYHFAGSSHNIYVESRGAQRIIYVCSLITTQLEVFDVTVPNAAVYLSTIDNPVWTYYSQPHAAIVHGNYLITTWMSGGFTIDDVSNLAAPVRLIHQYTTGNWAYHAALNAAGTHLITSDAPSGTSTVKIWSLANLTATVPSISLTGLYASPNATRTDDIVVQGNYAYVGCFYDGIRILDISNPAAPRLAGWYDTDPTSASSGTNATYGIQVAGNAVFATHTTKGLFIFDFVDSITITKAEWRKSTKVLTVEATSTAAPGAILNVTGYGAMTYNSGTGRYTLTQGGVLTKPASVTITSDLGASATRTVTKR